MKVLFLLIPISLVTVAVGVAIFFWALRTGQYEDLDSPAYKILEDDKMDD